MKKIFILSLLFIYPTYADLFTSDIIDGCRSDVLGFTDAVSINAVFEPKQFTCKSGQYLPIASVSCEACPVDAICTSGTYSFNEKRSGGITYNSLLTQNKIKGCDEALIGFTDDVSINAVFEPKQIDCIPGYYLVGNSETCTECPQNNKCVGGTYTFNETTTQGIEPCPNGTFSPGGTAYCYEHILHIGEDIVYLKSDKLTTPSLNIGMNDGIFYANMTTEPTLMNKDSEHYLKLEFNNTVYYVCDDTTCGG